MKEFISKLTKIIPLKTSRAAVALLASENKKKSKTVMLNYKPDEAAVRKLFQKAVLKWILHNFPVDIDVKMFDMIVLIKYLSLHKLKY